MVASCAEIFFRWLHPDLNVAAVTDGRCSERGHQARLRVGHCMHCCGRIEYAIQACHLGLALFDVLVCPTFALRLHCNALKWTSV